MIRKLLSIVIGLAGAALLLVGGSLAMLARHLWKTSP